MNTLKPHISSSSRSARQLRVTVHLPKGHTLEGMAVRASTLVVQHAPRRYPDRVLTDSLRLEAPLRGREASCFVKQENGEEVVILWGPLEQGCSAQRSA